MALNPVENNLVLLNSEWSNSVADSEKRLHVWQVPENAVRIVQCFFEAQKYETDYSTDDLFIVLPTPFENSIQYAQELKDNLRGQYDASIEDLKEQKLPTDWSFDPAKTPDTVRYFIDALKSFESKYHTYIGHLVAVLTPISITDPSAFAAWLSRALETNIPEQLRLMVVDNLENPVFSTFINSDDNRIKVDTIDIDGLTTAQETFAQERTVGPAGVFRNHLMGVVTLVEKGSVDQVRSKAQDALDFAKKQGWPDQEVAVRMLVAGAYLKESRHSEAIHIYREARQNGYQTVDAGHPAGNKLVLQTWFGEAGAELAAGNIKQAADCYDQATQVAQNENDHILTIEALRMGVFCYCRLENSQEAVSRGEKALKIGDKLKPEEREMTTLPVAAVDILRAIDPDRVSQLELLKTRSENNRKEIFQSTEQSAVNFEKNPDPVTAQKIETELQAATEKNYAEAEQTLQKIVSGGNQNFRHYFTRARRLLGLDWPLKSPIALAVLPESATEDPPGSKSS